MRREFFNEQLVRIMEPQPLSIITNGPVYIVPVNTNTTSLCITHKQCRSGIKPVFEIDFEDLNSFLVYEHDPV